VCFLTSLKGLLCTETDGGGDTRSQNFFYERSLRITFHHSNCEQTKKVQGFFSQHSLDYAAFMILFLRVFLLLLVCLWLTVADAQQEDLEELAMAREKWNLATQDVPSNDYSFMYEPKRNGVADAQRVVEVRDNVVTSAEEPFAYGKDTLVPVVLADYPTVEGLFDIIQSALENGDQVITVDYDKDYGYTSMLFIRYAEDNATLEISIDWMTLYSVSQKELDLYRTRWNNLEISDYGYTIQVLCFCEQGYVSPKAIQVQNDAIVSVALLETGVASQFTNYDTVEDLFVEIQGAIDDFASTITVHYDETLGYPTLVSINPDLRMADAATDVTISDLVQMIVEPVESLGAAVLKTTLDDSRAMWVGKGLNSYTYVYQRSCNCLAEVMEPKLVKVVDGQVVSVNGQAVQVIERAVGDDSIPTLDGLLDEIQKAIDSNAFQVKVEYDQVYGYPRSILIDYEEFVADEELIVSAQLEEEEEAAATSVPAPTPTPIDTTPAPIDTTPAPIDTTAAPIDGTPNTKAPTGAPMDNSISRLTGSAGVRPYSWIWFTFLGFTLFCRNVT
jgi:hypothetical protein